MSKAHYFTIHELLSQLPLRQIEVQVKAPHLVRRPLRRPRVRHNGIYFMYQKGETFTFENKTYKRIVYVGISKGRLEGRLNDYTRINFYPPLKAKIEKALSIQKGVLPDAISPYEVDNYVTNNFTRRVLFLPSADEAKKWERRIIPTIAQYSSDFISRDWLGKLANLRYGIWNTKYTSCPLTLEDKDLLELSELIKPICIER